MENIVVYKNELSAMFGKAKLVRVQDSIATVVFSSGKIPNNDIVVQFVPINKIRIL